MVTPAFYLLAILSTQAITCARQDEMDLMHCIDALATAGTEVYLSNEEPAWLKSRADFGRDPEGVREQFVTGAWQLVNDLREELGD